MPSRENVPSVGRDVLRLRSAVTVIGRASWLLCSFREGYQERVLNCRRWQSVISEENSERWSEATGTSRTPTCPTKPLPMCRTIVD